ncbi:unnamed protein product, partial [Timema podura]|nr:unnamed protein product [Timema podura]
MKKVRSFKNLGTTINKNDNMEKEILARIQAANKCDYVLNKIVDWRWNEDQLPNSSKLFKEDCSHRKIIKWFGDNPSPNSPLSIHMLVSLGEASGKRPGDWYGPGAVAHLL